MYLLCCGILHVCVEQVLMTVPVVQLHTITLHNLLLCLVVSSSIRCKLNTIICRILHHYVQCTTTEILVWPDIYEDTVTMKNSGKLCTLLCSFWLQNQNVLEFYERFASILTQCNFFMLSSYMQSKLILILSHISQYFLFKDSD